MNRSALALGFSLLLTAGSLATSKAVHAARESVASATIQPDMSQGQSRFDATAPGALEVKKVKTGHLLVRPIVNGKQAGWFIFDTGAGICVIATAKKDQLALVDAGELAAVGVGGAAQTRMYRARTMQLGPITLEDHPVMVTDLAFLTPHLGEEISGIVGYGVLSQCVAEVSISDASIILHDPRTYELTAGAWQELKLDGRVPRLRATVEGHDGVFKIDTGANSHITLHEPAVRRWNMLEGRETTETKLGGVGGFVTARRGTLREITLGGKTHEQVLAEFAVEAKGTFSSADTDGNIGAGLLSKYTIILDYAKQRICLR